MRTPDTFLKEYLGYAPAALALERCLEGSILSKQGRFENTLDLGCGDGIFAKIVFGSDGLDCGVDPDTSELNRANQLGVYRELIGVPGQSLPKPDASVDRILSNSVLEHIPDLVPVLKECVRVLKPGGSAYFTVPTANFERYSLINQGLETLRLHGLSRKFRAFFNRFWAHFHCYEIQEWKRLFESAGFQVEEVIGYASPASCLLNDFLAYLALPSAVARKFLSRWFFFPGLRRALVWPISKFLALFLPKNPQVAPEKAGLVFFRLRKAG